MRIFNLLAMARSFPSDTDYSMLSEIAGDVVFYEDASPVTLEVFDLLSEDGSPFTLEDNSTLITEY